ncbi:hypothetical protein BDR03DRAFT_1014991 [Suillus americanus]|nr:hypothetical protein BDR03DRAFT_1014991 [Suillus americanus]
MSLSLRYSPSTGKYDHIVELTSADIYPSWRRSVELALAGEGLWNHCSNGTDPSDVAEMASVMPTAATARQPTSTELTSMKDWVKEDAQARAIISRCLSPIVQNMLSKKLDVTSQFKLHDQLFSGRLKDADDASCNSEAVWMLLHGLLETPQWVVFHSLTLGLYKTPTSSTTSTTAPATVPPVTFEDIATTFLEEANCQ